MDFYWFYSRKEVVDPAGKANLLKAIGVASQVFNTLTEVIQGPCVGNQQTLAHSRLWDAVGGFLFLFAHMQEKLSKNSTQVDLLQELLSLQNDLIVMLLSMLEGNVLNGTIGKQMVDTLVESAGNVEMILEYFKLFLNLPGEDDVLADSSDGTIPPKDFKDILEGTKNYNADEIEFLLLCCDTNHEGNIEYGEFTGRFLDPAKEIGFGLAVLLTNLSEHMPSDPRLAKFLETAGTVLNFFEQFLGRIEIKTADKIERVYFEIDENNIEQWEKPQIRESKKAFFYVTITEGGDKEKLECFVDFCEDAIFEMQHADSLISSAGGDAGGGGGKKVSSGPSMPDEDRPRGIIAPMKEGLAAGRDALRFYLAYLHPTNLAAALAKAKTMTGLELALVGVTSSFWFCYGVGFLVIKVGASVSGVVLFLMRGERLFGGAADQKKKGVEVGGKLAAAIVAVPADAADGNGQEEGAAADGAAAVDPGAHSAPGGEQERGAQRKEAAAAATTATVDLQKRQAAAMAAVERMASAKSTKTEPSAVSTINFGEYIKKVISFLARNFFTMKFIALSIAFLINFMLLFYKGCVHQLIGFESGIQAIFLESDRICD